MNETICSSDEDDTFFDVSEELMSQDRSAYNAHSPCQNEKHDTIPIRKETAV